MYQNKKIQIFFLVFTIVLYHLYKPHYLSFFEDWSSQDFQWQPSKCVFEGINHYLSYLNEDKLCPQFKSQNGDYAQGLYIILYPFTLLEWNVAKISWSFLNLCLVILIPFLLCKKFSLKKIDTLLIIFFILYSKVTPDNLSKGQQGIFILFFLMLPFVFKGNFFKILSGISYFKYNIGYALFLLYLVKKQYKNIIYSSIPIFAGILLYCFFTSTNLFTNIFQPLDLMLKRTTVLDNIFLFSFIGDFLFLDRSTEMLITLLFSLIFNLFFIFKISKINDNLLRLSCLSLIILISTPHHGHDFILMVPLFVYSVKYYNLDSLLSKLNILVSIYFLHFYFVIPLIFKKLQILIVLSGYFESLILLTVLILNLIDYHFNKKNPQKFLSEGF